MYIFAHSCEFKLCLNPQLLGVIFMGILVLISQMLQLKIAHQLSTSSFARLTINTYFSNGPGDDVTKIP